jgi:hypothetical protein
MGETLIQQYRVEEEGPWVVNSCRLGQRLCSEQLHDLMVPKEEAPANLVPAAAVIRGVQALFGITGRKARLGG